MKVGMQIHYGTENIHILRPVVTIGSFDGVHKGHVQVIESLKKVAGRLQGETVIISFEPHPREVLYPQEEAPGILTSLEEKAEILDALGVEHLVILPFTRSLADLEYDEFVRHILVDCLGITGLIIGYDHRFGKNREGTFERLKELSARYRFYLEQEEVYEEHQINISSTKIRNALQRGDIARANEFLGYSYTLSGKVTEGDKIGRTLGFPTANIQLKDIRKQLPASGVYAVKVRVGEETYGGMLNIGVRPTVSSSGIARIEVHIFGFHQDIYGRELHIVLVARLRGERKFNDTQELQQQLIRDRGAVLACLHFPVPTDENGG